MLGYVYILKNSYMPGLVKIGFTDRDPKTRAAELSNFTGVPGTFEIVSSWYVSNAGEVEKELHTELHIFRRTGEFFEIPPQEAHEKIKALLISWGTIDLDGSSHEAKVLQKREDEKRERQKLQNKFKSDCKSLERAMSIISYNMSVCYSAAYRKAESATKPTGFFAFLKSKNESLHVSIHRQELTKNIENFFSKIQASWLTKVPEKNLWLPQDHCFSIGPSDFGWISPEEYASFWKERSHRQVQFEIYREKTKGKSFSVEEHNKYIESLGTPNPSKIFERFGNKAYVYRIPKNTRIVSATEWTRDERDIVGKVSKQRLTNIRTYSNKTCGIPEITISEKDLIIIIGDIK